MNKKATLKQAERTHLIYCVYNLRPGEFILLNRDYKPLGLNNDEWADYNQYPHLCLKFTGAEYQAIHCGSKDNSSLYLFNDTNSPIDGSKLNRLAYKKRLKTLQTVITRYSSVKNSDLLYWLD